MERVTDGSRSAGGAGLRFLRLHRPGAGFAPGDLVLVRRGAIPEGGEIVIDLHGRVGRHGGGPVWGVVVGAIRNRSPGRVRSTEVARAEGSYRIRS